MNFMFVWGFDLKQGKTAEFQKWCQANEEKLILECPPGCKYLGTYAAVNTSEKEAGGFRSLWEFENYAAQDTFSQAMKDGGTFARLVEECTAFMDQDNHAHWSSTLMRRVTDAAMWGD